jgi:hypothetical protein
MTTEASLPGEESRTAGVLHPSFVEGIEKLSIEEVRKRRDRALAEREFQSYLRRLIQVRHDILAAERTRRSEGGEPKPLVERLAGVLSEGPQGRGRGEALRVALPEADLAEAERQAEEILGSGTHEIPETLTDEELEELLRRLEEHERSVSANRLAVLRVHDRLQEELKRRYREDPSRALR